MKSMQRLDTAGFEPDYALIGKNVGPSHELSNIKV